MQRVRDPTHADATKPCRAGRLRRKIRRASHINKTKFVDAMRFPWLNAQAE
jgi:hypothetical protein